MKTLRPVLLLLVLAFVLNACKKDKDPAPPTKTDLLTAKPWKISAWTVNPPLPDSIFIENGTGFVQDIYAFYNSQGLACFNDNIKTFSKNPNSFSFSQGANKCDSTGDQYASGTWALSNNESNLALTFAGSNGGIDAQFDFSFPASGNIANYTITELTSTNLIYTYTLGSYTFTETLVPAQ